LKDLLARFCGGHIFIHYLDAQNQTVEVQF
jgi:hypothetical protein